MLQLIDRQLERRKCVECHVVCNERRRMVCHQFFEGCYHASLCPKCYLKRLEQEMAQGESVRMNLIFISSEAGVEPVITDLFRQVYFRTEKVSVTKPKNFRSGVTKISFRDSQSRKWSAIRYQDMLGSGYLGGDYSCKLMEKSKI